MDTHTSFDKLIQNFQFLSILSLNLFLLSSIKVQKRNKQKFIFKQHIVEIWLHYLSSTPIQSVSHMYVSSGGEKTSFCFIVLAHDLNSGIKLTTPVSC